MKLDGRKVIDQLTEDIHEAEVEDRAYTLAQLVDDATHELEHPLTVIQQNLDALEEAEVDPSVRQVLDATSDAVETWRINAKAVATELWDAHARFRETLDSFLAQ